MRYLIFFLFIVRLAALDIVLNTAKEDKKPYAILHLIDERSINCQENYKEFSQKEYICKFKGSVKTDIKNKNTPLLELEFQARENDFFVVIKPKFNSKLYDFSKSLYQNNEAEIFSKQKSNHIAIVIYDKLRFINETGTKGINFPIFYPELKTPSVGALDLNADPIEHIESYDVRLYLDIKKAYLNSEFNEVLKMTQEAMQKYPQSVFSGEFALYRLRSLDHIVNENEDSNLEFDNSNIIQEAKKWTRTYPSDNNIAEILKILAKAYLHNGARSDAEYILDILVSEHKDSKFTKLAIIDYADTLEFGGHSVDAQRLYQEVLYSATDLDVASVASIRLANLSLSKGKQEEAKEYFLKVLNANKNYMLKNKKKAYDLAQKIAQNKLYDIASDINLILLKDKENISFYEALLKDTGIWLSLTKNTKEAYKYLKKYQEEYKNGIYIDAVEEALDRLFFEQDESNSSKLYAHYDKLINKYKNDIGEKALIEKSALFLKENKFDEVLKLKRQLEDINSTKTLQILNKAAYEKAEFDLKNDNCSQVIALIEDYDIKAKIKNRHKLFRCMIRLSRYEEAINEAKSHIKDESLEERLEWIIKLTHAYLKDEKLSQSIQAANDALKLATMSEYWDASEVLYDKFYANLKLKNIDEAISIAKEIEKERQGEFQNAEVYKAIVDFAMKNSNHLLAKEFAQKILFLENEHKNQSYSPNIDFNYIISLEKLNEPKEAFNAVENLLKKDMDESERTRAFYVGAELSIKNNDKQKAIELLQDCIKVDVNNSWKSLCKDYLSTLDINVTK